MTSRLLELYRKKIMADLKNELKLDNIMSAPRIEKIVINAGIGKALIQNPKALDAIIGAIKKITGQQPAVKKAKKAIAGFKIRTGQVVGLAVTLRGKRMYDFLDKLINATLPRIRDFRGLSRSGFDKQGNYSLGLREHLVFPEMAQDDLETVFGMEVTIVTNVKNDEQAYLLLKKMRFPFKD